MFVESKQRTSSSRYFTVSVSLCAIILATATIVSSSTEESVQARLTKDEEKLQQIEDRIKRFQMLALGPLSRLLPKPKEDEDEETPPRIVLHPDESLKNHTTLHWVVGEPKRKLQCTATGFPMPKIHWLKIGGPEKLLPSRENRSAGFSELEFAKVDYGIEGYYKCVAKNDEGTDERVYHVIVDKEGISIVAVVIGSLAGLAIVVLSAFLIYLKLKNRKYKEEMKYIPHAYIESFINGSKSPKGNGKSGDTYAECSHQLIEAQPYNKEYEIPRNKIFVYEHLVLGSGEYGIVVQGAVHNPQYGNLLKVAIKTLKTEADTSYFKALLSELKIYIHVGKHPNVVNLIGACTENLRKRELYVAVEFCKYGNLKDFLVGNRQNYVDDVTKADCSQVGHDTLKRSLQKSLSEESRTTTTSDSSIIAISYSQRELIKWSYEIAKGMEFLASKSVIHADLAARNVLLTGSLVAKISDFGLSKQLMNYTNYVKKQQRQLLIPFVHMRTFSRTTLMMTFFSYLIVNIQCPLPWRWMAIESLRDYSFSTKSDVWSFGVCIWEIFSLGEMPYPGQVWNSQFLQELIQGQRMAEPAKASHCIYSDIMLPCWSTDPSERPEFFKLKQDLERLLESVSDQEYMDILQGNYAELMDSSSDLTHEKVLTSGPEEEPGMKTSSKRD